MITIPFISLFLTGFAPADPILDQEKMDLIGPVHTLQIQSIAVDEEPLLEVRNYTFDALGNTTQDERAYYQHGDLRGSLNSIHTLDPESNKEHVLTYTTDGSLSEKRIWSYDPNRNARSMERYNQDGSLTRTWIKVYNDTGRVIDQIFLRGDGSLLAHATTNIQHNDDGTVTEIHTYDMDDQENPARAKSNEDFFNYTVVLSYSEEGEISQRVLFNRDGSFAMRSTYRYYPNGKVAEKIIYNGDGSVREKETFDYEYDSMGNWIQEDTTHWLTASGDLQPHHPHVVQRSITYY